MLTETPTENYIDSWKKSSTQQKKNRIIAALNKILKKHYKKSIRIDRHDTLTLKCIHLKNLLQADNYDELLDHSKYRNIIECVANTVSDPMMTMILKNTFVFTDEIRTQNTTINNVSLFDALKDFSNFCAKKFVETYELKQHQTPSISSKYRHRTTNDKMNPYNYVWIKITNRLN